MSTAIDGNILEAIEQARGGDTGAFARIVRQYQSLISGVLYSATGDFHRSEDLAQETFLIAWKKLDELRDSENLAGWLCTIARNLVHSAQRKKVVSTAHGSLPDELPSSEKGPDAALLHREQSELVWSAIGEIEEPYRETLVLYYRGGESVRDIAAATESTEEAVRQRLVRARKSLKVKLEQLIGDVLSETAPGEAFTLTVMTAVGAAVISSTAQAALGITTGATTGTAATAAGTGGATTGKALGAATLWGVIGPAAFVGWMVAAVLSGSWASVRNAPTLRARRFRVYAIFWSLQYFVLLTIVLTVVMTGGGMLLWEWLHPKGVNTIPVFFIIYPLLFVMIIPLQLAYFRKLKKIVENDIGLPGPHIESYSYPQVERRFFLSLITNTFLAETILALFIGMAASDGDFRHPMFLALFFGTIAVAAVTTTVYYPLGRYFLEICRTKANFLAAPPLVDNPLEVVLLRTGKIPGAVDYPKATGKMSVFFFLTWIGIGGGVVWILAHYSWSKHPISLGVCAALLIAVFSIQSTFSKKMKRRQDAMLLDLLVWFCAGGLAIAFELIEFGGIYFSDVWTKTLATEPKNMIHVLSMSLLLLAILRFSLSLCQWLKARQVESDDEKSGKERLLREAIARFDPLTMIAEEPACEAKPFPKRWLWILGLYGTGIAMYFCIGTLFPSPWAHKKMLERAGNYTELIALEPNNPEWYLKRGMRYASGGGGKDLERAITDYDAAIRLKHNYREAFYERARARFAEISSEQGLASGETGPHDQDIQEKKAHILEDIDKAIRLAWPEIKGYYLTRANIRKRFGDLDGAEEDYDQVIKLYPGPSTYAMRRDFYEHARKDFRKAIDDCTKMIQGVEQIQSVEKSYSEYSLAELYRQRAELYEKLGESEQAKADLAKAAAEETK